MSHWRPCNELSWSMYVRREVAKVAVGRSRLSWAPRHQANGQLRRMVGMMISAWAVLSDLGMQKMIH